MRMFSFVTGTILLLVAGAGCDEAKGPAYAFGRGFINPPGWSASMNGSLGTSGNQDLYGYCKYSGNGLEFEVGHADLNHLSEAPVPQPLYFKFTGVVGAGEGGAPEQGVFEEGATDAEGNPVPKNGAEFYSTFATATVRSNETFNFSGDEGSCRVLLFAEAAEGELVPGFNKGFEYYVSIDCTGMSDVTGVTGGTLETVQLAFYLDNCD